MKTSRELIKLYHDTVGNKVSAPDFVDVFISERQDAAVAFADWIHDHAIQSKDGQWLTRNLVGENYLGKLTTSELFKKFKEENK